MTSASALAIAALLIGCFAYVFWPQARIAAVVEKTRLDYLRERRDVIYDNLRDLQFEHRAGKYPEEDFQAQRTSLEDEAAAVLAEMDRLTGAAQGRELQSRVP